MYLFLAPRTCLVTISVIFVDFATQAAINPCESLMADTIHNVVISENHTSHGVSVTSGFKVYSYMTTLGSCVGYLLATIDWTKTISRFTSEVSDVMSWSLFTPEQAAFILVTILFSTTALITMISTRERTTKHNTWLSNDGENPKHNALEKTSDKYNKVKFNYVPFHSIKTKLLSEYKCRKQIQMNASHKLPNYFIHLICMGINLIANYCIYASQYILCIVIMVLVYIMNVFVMLVTKVSKL